MRRRELIATALGALAAWPRFGSAQDSTKLPVIGFLNGAATATPLVDVIGMPKPLPAEFLALAGTMQL